MNLQWGGALHFILSSADNPKLFSQVSRHSGKLKTHETCAEATMCTVGTIKTASALTKEEVSYAVMASLIGPRGKQQVLLSFDYYSNGYNRL